MAPAVEHQMMKLVPPLLPFDRPRTFDEATLLTPTSQDGAFKVNLRADWAFGPSRSTKFYRIEASILTAS